MGKMKEVFQEEQESRSVQDKFLDKEWEMSTTSTRATKTIVKPNL